METFTIREAADRCGQSYQLVRKRVDRGSIRTVKREGVRRIPRAELERVGLWPGATTGAPEHVQQLEAELDRARRELTTLRALPAQIDAERQAREHIEHALHETRAAHEEAEANLRRLTETGPLERWRARRELRIRREAVRTAAPQTATA